jgi:hypothetical protein
VQGEIAIRFNLQIDDTRGTREPFVFSCDAF